MRILAEVEGYGDFSRFGYTSLKDFWGELERERDKEKGERSGTKRLLGERECEEQE